MLVREAGKVIDAGDVEHDQVAASFGRVDADDARPVAHGDAPGWAGTSASRDDEGDSARARPIARREIGGGARRRRVQRARPG